MIKQRRLVHWGAAPFLIALSLVLAACGGAAPAPSKPVVAPTTAPAANPAPAAAPAAAANPGSAAMPVVQVATGTNVMNSPWYIGLEKGLFIKQGLDVKLKLLNTGSEITKALQAGEVEVGGASVDVHIAAQSQGIKFTGFAMNVNDATIYSPDNMFAIIAQPTSNIAKPEDLKGKTIASTTGTSQDTYLKAVLAKAGVPADQVEFVNAQPNNIPAAFAGGQEVVVTTEPFGELILSRHPGAKLISRGGGYMGQRTAVTASEDWLKANRPVAEKLVAGLAEASFIIRTQPDVVADVIPRWVPGIDGPLANKAVAHVPFDPRMSRLVQESWERQNGLMVEQKKIKEPVAFNPAFDLSFFEDLPKKYPQFLADLKPLP